MTYRVIVGREGSTWLIEVPSVAGAFSASDDLRLLDTYAREVCLGLDEPDEAMAAMEFEWVLAVPARDLVREFGRGWTLADVADALDVPVERVTHTPPSLAERFGRWVTLMRLTWRYRRFDSSRDDEDTALAAGAVA